MRIFSKKIKTEKKMKNIPEYFLRRIFIRIAFAEERSTMYVQAYVQWSAVIIPIFLYSYIPIICSHILYFPIIYSLFYVMSVRFRYERSWLSIFSQYFISPTLLYIVSLLPLKLQFFILSPTFPYLFPVKQLNFSTILKVTFKDKWDFSYPIS